MKLFSCIKNSKPKTTHLSKFEGEYGVTTRACVIHVG
jgi:hypothetical protein